MASRRRRLGAGQLRAQSESEVQQRLRHDWLLHVQAPQALAHEQQELIALAQVASVPLARGQAVQLAEIAARRQQAVVVQQEFHFAAQAEQVAMELALALVLAAERLQPSVLAARLLALPALGRAQLVRVQELLVALVRELAQAELAPVAAQVVDSAGSEAALNLEDSGLDFDLDSGHHLCCAFASSNPKNLAGSAGPSDLGRRHVSK